MIAYRNDKLRAMTEAQDGYEQQRQKDRMVLDEACRQKILALARDLPRLWRDPSTSDQDRKRIVRLLIEDVTLIRGEKITVNIRFKGGAIRTLTLPVPLSAWQQRTTDPAVIRHIDRLLDTYTEGGVAAELNRRGIQSGMNVKFNTPNVARLRKKHKLKSRYDRLREKGLHTVQEMATELGVSCSTVKTWGAYGLLRRYEYNDKGGRLYELPPENERPKKQQGQRGRLSGRGQHAPFMSHAANKVHHEA